MKKPRGVKTETREKYSQAITLYTETSLSIKQICEQTGVGAVAFSSFLSTHHRDLILKRHHLTGFSNVKLRGQKGQTTAAHYKYRDAIAACDSQEYIEYNISQIARIFDVNSSSLASQLRRHYSDIIPRREMIRRRMGIHTNLQYGARQWSKEEYAEAVEMLKTSDMTIDEVANACRVSYTGLREHIIAYHPQITASRENKRTHATGQKVRGKRNGNWAVHEPGHTSIEKYEEAIELYRTTSLDVKEIARITSVKPGGLRHYLRTWHPEMMVQRRGFEGVCLEDTKRYKKSTAEKYAGAIEKLEHTNLPTAKVAAEFGLKPETFRRYLKEHCPELVEVRGMVKTSNGKIVSNRSAEKYAEALHLYETTPESLKSIAHRLGLTYNSVGGFIRRNHPESIERHNALLVPYGERFAKGIEMLRNSTATIHAVMEECGYNEYFRVLIKAHYPELLHRKVECKKIIGTKAAANKYAAAIELMRTTTDTMKDIAHQCGVNVHSFRKYLYKHAPEILQNRLHKT